jgi:hypothetical protein
MIVIALCLIGTVIWAFQKYVTIPEPFGWVKGILTFVLIVLACYFVWTSLESQHFLAGKSGLFK